ncbi:phage head closure protein [[Clostridium] symbiosum]|uniref:phage head closure protein n=1 Tax=Clostridium symbiosum TaxID=1512 RepID=UPI0021087BCB|nr:phage head closure protein [[Clostridium] symbiosum]MCQ4833651.1 phage head closure protein [[Clostridium] symbiosum]
MRIGQWRQRIVIQQNRMKKDKDGNQRNEWEDYFTCWAYANNLSGKEYWEAAQVNREEALFFLVRYCSELEGLDSTKYRILFRGDIYNITLVDFVQFQNKVIKLRAERVKR